jgi:hypothetical protein
MFAYSRVYVISFSRACLVTQQASQLEIKTEHRVKFGKIELETLVREFDFIYRKLEPYLKRDYQKNIYPAWSSTKPPTEVRSIEEGARFWRIEPPKKNF